MINSITLKRIKIDFQVNEVLWKDLGGRNSVLNADEAEQYFNRMKKEKEIYKTNDMVDVLNEFEQILSEKLSPDQVNRMVALVRIYEGTPTAIKNSLVRI